MSNDIKLPFNNFYKAIGQLNNRKIREYTGADHYSVKRAEANGLTIDQADKWCEKFALAPYEVWDNWVDIILADK